MGRTTKPTWIGMTEAGDAGWDLSWYDTMLQNEDYVGAILITKAVFRPEFQSKVIDFINKKPCIIHAGCTGWGGSKMEPGLPEPEITINAIRHLIDAGFPAENIVLRIDPIIQTDEGIERAKHVMELATATIPDVKRIRISIYDDYHHSREEMCRRGYAPIDKTTKWKNEMERRPNPYHIKQIAEMLMNVSGPDQHFELCAEPELEQAYPDRFHWTGCLSHKDCEIMGIHVPSNIGINGQNRFGCKCLKMKRELLNKKRRCNSNCAYCYWGRN